MKVKYFNKNILNIKLGQRYQVANEIRSIFIFAQIPTKYKHEKKKHEYKPYILVINLILKKLISLLMKIVIIILNIIINIIAIENSNKKELFIIGWFN